MLCLLMQLMSRNTVSGGFTGRRPCSCVVRRALVQVTCGTANCKASVQTDRRPEKCKETWRIHNIRTSVDIDAGKVPFLLATLLSLYYHLAAAGN